MMGDNLKETLATQASDNRSDVADLIEFEPLENPSWRSKDESDVQEYPSVEQMITDIVKFQRKEKNEEVNTVQRERIQKYFLSRFILNNNDEERHGVGTIEETEECIKIVQSKKPLEKAPSKNEQETMNVYKAYQYLHQKVNTDCEEDKGLYGLLESSIVKDVHKIIFENIVRNKNYTAPGECSKNPRTTTFKGEEYSYQDPEDMDKAMGTVLDRYNSLIDGFKDLSDDTSRIRKLFKTSSWLLFELLDLHPFGDGNGRLCRLLCNYALSVFTPFPTPIYNIWSKSSKDDYRQALVDARKSSSKHPEALTTMLIECNWLAWKEFYRQLEQSN